MALASDVIAMSVVIGGVIGQGKPVQGAQSFSQFIGFGDSAIDSGYFFTHNISNNPTNEAQYQASVAAGGGIPTSLGGVMNSVLLAQDFGLTAIPVGEPGGTNYAASGATVTGVVNPGSLAPSIVSQITTYLASVNNHADPNALYLISGGGNDLKVAETLTGTAAQDAYIVQQANTFAQAIEQLYAAGARYIVINDQSGPGDLGRIFIETLFSSLAAAGVSFISTEIGRNVVDAVDANPAAFGITNTTEPPAGPFTASNPYNPANGGADINPIPSLIPNSWSLGATQLVSPNAGQTYLWSDDEHLSAAGQQIEANYLYNLIENNVPTVNETLKANANVEGNSSGEFTYQWQSLAPGQTWTNIAGATHPTFVVQQADVGLQLRVEATYTDSAGTSTDVSQATPAVTYDVVAQTIQNDFFGITRGDLSSDQASVVANSINAGTQTETQYVNGLLAQVANTTIPVVAVEASMYGAVGSSAVITNLVTNFLPDQLAYANQVGLDPEVFACLETALVFAFSNESGSTTFANNFGPSNAAMPATHAGDAAFAAAATNAIFGSAQTANTANALLGYVHFLEGFFTANGIVGVTNPTPDQIVIAARAGAWGEGFAIALENNLGALPGQVTNFLEDAAQGTAIYSASLSSQPNHAPFQGAASASVATTTSNVQVTGVAAHVDHIAL